MIYFGKVRAHKICCVLPVAVSGCTVVAWYVSFRSFWIQGHSIFLAVQIRPLEETYKFGAFFSSYLNESDFYAKPSVLLLGQYSTGNARVPCLSVVCMMRTICLCLLR